MVDCCDIFTTFSFFFLLLFELSTLPKVVEATEDGIIVGLPDFIS